MQPQIPLLVQDIIDFYRRRLWLQKLHKEYVRRVCVGYSQLSFCVRYNKLPYTYHRFNQFRTVCRMRTSPVNKKVSVKSFTNYDYAELPLPPKYRYSSGLDHPSAYKKLIQPTQP